MSSSTKPKPKKRRSSRAPLPPENVYPVLAVPGYVLPVFLGGAALLFGAAVVFFQPPGGMGHWGEKSTFLLLLVLGLLCTWVAFSTRQLRVEVIGRELHVKGDLFSKKVDAGAVRVDRARIVNLASDPDCGLSWRVYGVPLLPGYTMGCFLLHRGGWAWTLLTDRSAVLWLPTTEGATFLLSIDRAEHLLARLQKFAERKQAEEQAARAETPSES